MSRKPGAGQQTVTLNWSADQIDVACDEFETAFRQGRDPQISTYVRRCHGPSRKKLFSELMLVELDLHKQHGTQRSYEQYRDEYPEFADAIETIAFKHGLSTKETRALKDVGTDAKPGRPLVSDDITHVGHFQLQQRVGAGGMGQVWKAFDARLKRTVAVKIPHGVELDEQGLHRFLREGRAAAQLNHPGIVRVHEVARDGELAYIVSDFIDGQNLKRWAADRVTKPREAAEMVAKLADAVHHAHDHGVIHRDLKPANVLLDQKSNPHITDFGVAKWSEDTWQMTLKGDAIGTPAYMSPEQARGDSANVDRRTDVYALGVILYELMTGILPFRGDEPHAVIRSILDDTPRPPRQINPEIPRDLETICLKALEKEPHRRYATAQEMAVDLQRFLRGDDIIARRASVPEKTVRALRKRPAVTSAIGLAFLALCSMGVAALTFHENRSLTHTTVRLDTKPSGARVAFVPLDSQTLEPQGEQAVYPKQRTPLAIQLLPGKYLVVAALDDGRFQEVYRLVPAYPDAMGGMYRESTWYRAEEFDGAVLYDIHIPDSDVVEGMVLIQSPTNTHADNAPGSATRAFYIDPHEFTLGDWKKSTDNEPASKNYQRIRPRSESHAMTVSFGEARKAAENAGKRLPTAAEWELAASLAASFDCDETGMGEADDGFRRVGMPDCDRAGPKNQIIGLNSNVAEWTSTYAKVMRNELPTNVSMYLPVEFREQPDRYPHYEDRRPIQLRSADPGAARHYFNHYLVKGGDLVVIDGNPTTAIEHRRHSHSMAVMQYLYRPGIGFRCVRSARPRFLPEE